MSINTEPFQRTDISMKPLGPAKNKKTFKKWTQDNGVCWQPESKIER
jgi:hypothetical protein